MQTLELCIRLQSLPMSYWASTCNLLAESANVILGLYHVFSNFFAVTVIYTPCFHEFRTTYREMLLKLQTGTSSWSGSE